jgi:hypothetical protein
VLTSQKGRLPKRTSELIVLPSTNHHQRVLSNLKLDCKPLSWYSSRPNVSSSTSDTAVLFKPLDFFTFPLPSSPTGFTLAWDLTFFCALPPSLRKPWAERYTELLATPEALLVTLVLPIDGEREGGPPFSVSLEAYEDVLGPLGWERTWEGEGGEKGRLVVWRKSK